MASRDAGLDEVGAEPVLLVAAESGHRHHHTLAAREPQRRPGVVRQPDVSGPRIRVRHAQARDRLPVQGGGSVEDPADLHPGEPEPGVRPDDAGAHRHDHGVGVGDVAGHRQRREDRNRLEIAAERVAARDRGVDQRPIPQLEREIREGERQPRSVRHHVREAGIGYSFLERHRRRRQLAVQRRRHDRHAFDRLDLGQFLEMLLGAPHVGLQARVPALDDVPRTSLRPLLPLEVPVDDVPPTSSQPELDRGRVHDDPVPHRDIAGQLGENVRTLVPLT